MSNEDILAKYRFQKPAPSGQPLSPTPVSTTPIVLASNVSEQESSDAYLTPQLMERLKQHSNNQALLEILRELGHIQQSITTLALTRNRGPRIKSKTKVWTTILNGAIEILTQVQKEDLDSVRALLILTKEKQDDNAR